MASSGSWLARLTIAAKAKTTIKALLNGSKIICQIESFLISRLLWPYFFRDLYQKF